MADASPRIDICGSEGSAPAPGHTVNQQHAWLGLGPLPLSPLTPLLLTKPGVSHLGGWGGEPASPRALGAAGKSQERRVCTSHTEERRLGPGVTKLKSWPVPWAGNPAPLVWELRGWGENASSRGSRLQSSLL